MAREDMKMMSELYDREAEEDSAHPCPKCQENQILEGDYVCEKCRFG